MKKIFWCLLLFLFIPVSVKAISAETAIVMDQDSGRVLYGKSIHKQKLIASTTKIMTAIIAIEKGNLSQNVKIGEEILAAYGSNIYIEIGEIITLEDLIYGLMLRSGNDAAIAISQEVAGSMEKFAALMNYKAKEIGMENTVFYNAHGLEEKNKIGNKSTAYDMAKLTQYAMKNSTFRKIFSTKSYNAKSNYKSYSWTNKNRLFHTYKYTTGGKTGFTELARRTLVTTASKDGKNLIVVTLNDGDDFKDHEYLYEKYFNSYQLVKVLDKNNFKIKDDKHYKAKEVTIQNDYKMLVTNDEKDSIKTVVELNKKKWQKDNSKIGVVKVYLKDDLMHEEGIYLKKEIATKKPGFFKRVWDFLKFWD